MKNLLIGPIMVPLIFGAICLGFRGKASIERMLFAIGTWVHLGICLTLIERTLRGPAMRMQVGGWAAPFAIEIALDRTSAVFLAATSIIGAVIGSHVLGEARNALDRRGRLTVMSMLLGGISGVFLASDMFNMFVWFELTMLCSFVLLAIGGHRDQLEAALKYVVLNLVASTLFLCALGYLYGSMGSLSMRQIAAISHSPGAPATIPGLASIFMVTFAIKSALFPLSSWLPASYHTAHATTNALMVSTLTKLGIYSLLRVFMTVFPFDALNRNILLYLACGSILFGGIGALVQNNLRRLISFVLITQIGILTLGIVGATELSLAGTLILVLNEMLCLAGLILLIGRLETIFGSTRLSEMGGLYTTHPTEAAWLGIFFLNLAGIPPLAGFIGKATLLAGNLGTAGVTFVLVGSFLTLAAFVRVWVKVAWRPAPEGVVLAEASSPNSYVLLGALGFLLTLGMSPIMAECRIAASDVLYKPTLLPQNGPLESNP